MRGFVALAAGLFLSATVAAAVSAAGNGNSNGNNGKSNGKSNQGIVNSKKALQGETAHEQQVRETYKRAYALRQQAMAKKP